MPAVKKSLLWDLNTFSEYFPIFSIFIYTWEYGVDIYDFYQKKFGHSQYGGNWLNVSHIHMRHARLQNTRSTAGDKTRERYSRWNKQKTKDSPAKVHEVNVDGSKTSE